MAADESIREEVLIALKLKLMKNNKAAGTDKIPAEVYTNGARHTIDI